MQAEGYQPHFDNDLERGKVGESLLSTFLSDLEDGAKFEVKTDYLAHKTGNFYIETWQYGREDESDKKQSGINTTKADWWVFAGPSGNGFIAIRTQDLKDLMTETNPRETRQPKINANTNASIGRLVPVKDIIKKAGLRNASVGIPAVSTGLGSWEATALLATKNVGLRSKVVEA